MHSTKPNPCAGTTLQYIGVYTSNGLLKETISSRKLQLNVWNLIKKGPNVFGAISRALRKSHGFYIRHFSDIIIIISISSSN